MGRWHHCQVYVVEHVVGDIYSYSMGGILRYVPLLTVCIFGTLRGEASRQNSCHALGLSSFLVNVLRRPHIKQVRMMSSRERMRISSVCSPPV
jgi:hypothetical protein